MMNSRPKREMVVPMGVEEHGGSSGGFSDEVRALVDVLPRWW